MNHDDNESGENIAATLAKVLPTAQLHVIKDLDPWVGLFTLPIGVKVETIDLERFRPTPRRKAGVAIFSDATSFIDYVKTHAKLGTTAWAKFDPQTSALAFTAVLDEHSSDEPGWRQHRATFTPDMSVEWKTWIPKDKKPFGQLEFAEFIEANAVDFAPIEGMPTDLQMLEMATKFVANEERMLKSSIRLQNGGVNLSYVADVDAGTVETMTMFNKFSIGIPVFQDGGAWGITARLKYRLSAGKVSFYYELIRTDRVHRSAAMGLIQVLRDGLGEIPLLMGGMS